MTTTKKNNKLVQYIVDSYAEMKKVTWPTKEQTIQLTVAVILISLFLAIFLGILDFVFSTAIKKIIITFAK